MRLQRQKQLEDLRVALGAKICAEYKDFEESILRRDKKEIYYAAYRIDAIVCIYEELLELIQNLSADKLNMLFETANLLVVFYEFWLNTEDDVQEQLSSSIKKTIRRLGKNRREKSA